MTDKSIRNKKVLIIATAFPPTGGSGALRTTKFVKYLPLYGWQPYVLALKSKYFSRIDHDLMNDIPEDVLISRSGMFQLYEYLRYIYGKMKGIKSTVSVNESENIIQSDNSIQASVKPEKFNYFLIKDWLNFPDKYMGWIPVALIQARKLCKRHNIPIIYTTSPPVTIQWIGLYLKKILGNYWIVDFRDPWDIDSTNKNLSIRRKRKEEKLRKKVLINADRIIVNTNEAWEKLIQNHPEISKDKVFVITNGYDQMDFQNLERHENKDPNNIVISHVGELYSHGRRPDLFLECLSELMKENKLIDKNIKVRFIGDEDFAFSSEFQKLITRLNLQSNVEIQGFISHHESILKLMESDLLLLLQTGKRFDLQIPAKIYEYMATEKPIFSLSPSGATTNLMKKYPLGFNAEPENKQMIKKELIKYFEGGFSKDIDVSNFVKQFDRKTLTGQLTEILDNLVSKSES